MRRIGAAVLVVLGTLLAGCAREQAAPVAARGPDAAAPDTAGPPVVPATAGQIRARAARPGARATLVNVWATWCVPCRQEFPALLKVAGEEKSHGLRLMLVSADFDDQLPAVRKFLADHAITDTTWLKTEGDMDFINGLSADWTGALPATFVYDSAGRLVTFWEGMADEPRFRGAIAQALGSHAPTEDSRP